MTKSVVAAVQWPPEVLNPTAGAEKAASELGVDVIWQGIRRRPSGLSGVLAAGLPLLVGPRSDQP